MFASFPFPTASPADTPGDVGGLKVLIPPVYEIFWSALILLGLWLVLGWALPKLYGMLDKRQEQIDAGLNAADKATEDAALAKREREDALRKAQEEAKAIRDGAQRDAGRIIAQARTDAQAESERITEAAKAQIETERTAAAVALRKDVGALATELAERIVGEQLKDSALSQRVIDRFMDDVQEDMQSSPVGADA